MAGFFDEKDVIRRLPPSEKQGTTSSFFDPADVIQPQKQPTTSAPTPPVQPIQPVQQASSFFDKEDIEAAAPNVDYQAVRKIIDRPFFSAPLISSEQTTEKEIQAIANQHGISPDQLRSKATFFGAQTKDSSLAGKLASSASRGVALNLPQFAAKKAETDPRMRAALDDIQSLADSKRSFLQGTAEAVTGLLTPGGAAAKGASALKTVGTLAATGAAAGLGQSKEGSEVASTAIGGTLGAGLAGAGVGIGKYLSRGASKAESALIKRAEASPALRLDLEDASRRAQQKFSSSEDIIERSLLGGEEIPEESLSVILKEQLSPEELVDRLDSTSLEGKALRAISARDGVSPERALVNEIQQNRAISVADELEIDTPTSLEHARILFKKAEAQGPEYVRDKYKIAVDTKNTGRLLEQEPSNVGSPPGMAVDLIQRKIGGTNPYLQWIDHVYNTKLRHALSEFSRDTSRATFAKKPFRVAIDSLARSEQKAGNLGSWEEAGDLIYKYEAGGFSELNPAEQNIVRKVKGILDSVKDHNNVHVLETEGGRLRPLGIATAENYLTRTAVDMPQMVSRIDGAMDELAQSLSTKFGRDIKNIGSLTPVEYKEALKEPLMQQLVDVVNWRSVKKDAPRSAPEIFNSLKDLLYTREGNIAMQKQARFAMERTGEIPRLIRETNLFKIMMKYMDDGIDTVYKRRGIDMLRSEAKKLKMVGAETESKYITNIIQDSLGIREGTLANAQRRIQREVGLHLRKRIDRATGSTKFALETVDDFLLHGFGALSRNLYPNVMGFSVRSIMQNAVSGFTRTVPELGGSPYVVSRYTEAFGRMIMDKKKFREIMQYNMKSGYVPDEYIKPAQEAFAKGLASTSLWKLPAKAIEGLSKLGMSGYSLAENVNRTANTFMSRMIAEDLIKGVPAAAKSLTRLPPDLQRMIGAAQARGDVGAVSELLGKHINDQTAFNYNRQSLFELGRELGPMFSTFAKWPTETLGETLLDLRSKGLLKGGGRFAEKMIVPLLALTAMDHAVTSIFGLEDSARYKKLVGAQGLSQSAPIRSLGGAISGDIISSPPMIKAFREGVMIPLMRGDEVSLVRGVDALAHMYLPGAGTVRFLTDDMATLIEGEKPEGGTRTEKALNVLDKWSK